MAFSPPISLKDHCSVIDGSTLYAFSPDGFQSLELKAGASWKRLPSGVSVEGAQCVLGVPNGEPSEAGLFVVGGVSKSTSYSGLQKYTFSTGKWHTIFPLSTPTKNLRGHGATFLNATNQILTYAGTTTPDQDPVFSSSTFLVDVVPPFGSQALSGPPAPPLLYPLVLPLNESNAVMVGGLATSTGIFTFEPNNGWANLGVTLQQPLTDQTKMQCTVMVGDDGSRVLETYNLGVSPNLVTRQALIGPGGQLMTQLDIVAPPRSSKQKQKRELTLKNWPKYNASLAPAVTRARFSIASEPNGLAVISGGDQGDPLAIFNQRANSWEDPSTIFGSQDVAITSDPSASVNSAPSSTSSSAATSSAAAAAASSSSDDSNQGAMLTVLGATLGSIFGVAAILVIILLLLRWRREKNKRRYQTEVYADEKDRLSFADRGDDEFMKETGGILPEYRPLPRDDRTRSSVGIMSGGGHKRGAGLGSDSSTMGLISKPGPLGYNDPVELSRMDPSGQPPINRPAAAALNTQAHRDNNGRSRSSGWSRYFANNEATNLAQIGPERSTFVSDRTSATNSVYTDSGPVSHPSQEVPPLDLGLAKYNGAGLNRVATNSPTLGHSREDVQNAGMAVTDGMKAELTRARSTSTVSSAGNHEEDDPNFASNNQGKPGWTPMPPGNWNRAPSSVYPESARESRNPTSSYYANTMPSYYQDNDPGRESTVTVFPRGVPSYNPKDKSRQTANTDMSWLNLSHNNNNSNNGNNH